MSLHCREPRLEEMLADSIIQALMEADRVDPRELERELRQAAALLHATWRVSNPPAFAPSDIRGKRGVA